MKEEGIEIDVKDISDFKNHPFKINNDLNYEELKNSIIDYGVLVPTIVRQKDDGNMKCYLVIEGKKYVKNKEYKKYLVL